MKTDREDIQLLPPEVERDAPFALGWFSRPEGKQTLLNMGNAEREIKPSTLESEKAILQEFIDLEKADKQITRMIVADDHTIGAVWIELFENHGLKAPSVHIIIGNPDYRGRGIGQAALQAAINYTTNILKQSVIYSRHLVSNQIIASLNHKLGFTPDGSPYTDNNGLVWQNVRLKAGSAGSADA